MFALAISANGRYLAVSERAEKATIAVVDLHHEPGKKKRKVLTAGDIPVQEFICMAFSPDSKYLIGQTGAPEWTLIFWFWEKHKILATVRTSTSNNPVKQVSHAWPIAGQSRPGGLMFSCFQVSFSPFNHMQLCVSGAGVFKLFRYAEGCLKQSSLAKVDSIDLLSHAWIAAERVVAGTDTGRLLVFENGDLRRELLTSPAGQGQPDRSEGAASGCHRDQKRASAVCFLVPLKQPFL